MLIATPYRDLDVRDRSPPKVISEVRKTYLNCAGPNMRPKLTGDLLIKTNQDKNWHRRRTQIRGGQLHVSPVVTQPDELLPPITAIRLPLRHLSLQAGPLPHSLALCRGQNVVLMLQTENEQTFDEWVKTIAIELIRQTPLDAIKYLDILTLSESYNDKANQTNEHFQSYLQHNLKSNKETSHHIIHSKDELTNNQNAANNLPTNQSTQNLISLHVQNQNAILNRSSTNLDENHRSSDENQSNRITYTKNEHNRTVKKDCNQNILVDEVDFSSCHSCNKNQENPKKKPERILQGACLRKSQEAKTPVQQADQEKIVENLLKKCQNSENYVPVKEKLVLFESLCKMGRKVRSTEDVSQKPETSNTKRAKSLQNLSNINTHIAVREICKYFENRNNLDTTENKNVIKSSIVKRLNFDTCGTNTENLYKFQKVIVT